MSGAESRLRLAIVTRHFWPHVSGQSAHLLRLAGSLIAAGHEVTVVTPRWSRHWPQQIQIGTVPVVRLRGSTRGGLSTIRWMYDLAQWLSENRPDRVLVAGLRHEAYVALGVDEAFAARAVLLADDDDLAWQRGATFGNRIARRCQQAFTVVAASQPLADALVGGGYSNKQVTVIPRHVPLPPPRSPVARSHARAALSAVNADLVTAPGAAVALAVGRLDAAHRFGDLVRAWRIVTARRPDARLWIIGDGPDREPLYRQIGDLDQRFRVLIPGSFDCLDDLLQAVDLVIVPGYRLAPSLTLLTAQAAGLPVIASDAPGSALAIQNGATGVLYQLGDIPALAQNVLRLIEQPAYGVQLGAAARAVAQASAGRTEPCAFEHLFGNHIKR